MQAERPDIMYLSTTDYIQHKHAPGTPVANDFYAHDGRLSRRSSRPWAATIVFTADHGMNDKHGADGKPQVIYLQDTLDELARVPALRASSCRSPILMSCITARWVRLPPSTCRTMLDHAGVIAVLAKLPGMELVVDRADGCRRFELPEDRVGDVIAVSAKNFALGTAVAKHDLSGLDRAVALAWRHDRAAGAGHRQSR